VADRLVVLTHDFFLQSLQLLYQMVHVHLLLQLLQLLLLLLLLLLPSLLSSCSPSFASKRNTRYSSTC
jgi:hypothetical protein